jgi:serine protease Do
VQFVVGRLIKYGWVEPAWIGVKVQQVTREIAEAMGKGSTDGSVVSWIIPGGPASKSGIAIGDVIMGYGDDKPKDERALLRDITQTPIGDTVKVVLLRGETQLTLPVTVEPWPRSQWDERDAPMTPARPKLTIPPGLGLSLAVIQKDQRAKLGLEDGLNGVLITSVLPGSDAARRGAVAGDVILRVQDTPVATPGEVQHALLAVREEKRPFVMMLVLPKVRKVPGPRWVTLRVAESDG